MDNIVLKDDTSNRIYTKLKTYEKKMASNVFQFYEMEGDEY